MGPSLRSALVLGVSLSLGSLAACHVSSDELEDAVEAPEPCAPEASDEASLRDDCVVAEPEAGDVIGRSRDRARDTLERDRTEEAAPLAD